MVPVRKGDNGRVVIDVVERRMRVIGVVDDEGATKTVAVLCRMVTVVPECTRLVGHIKLIVEGVPRRDRTLSHRVSPISP